MNATKITNTILTIILFIRLVPPIAFSYVWFENDPIYIKVLELYFSAMVTFCSILVFALFIKYKRRLFWAALWLLFECIYLTHHITMVFTTDTFNSYLVMLGIVVTPLFVINIKKVKSCLQSLGRLRFLY